MSDILDFYQQQAQKSISVLPWLSELQLNAQQDLAQLGFPTRKNEEWKYTNVDSFLAQPFSPPKQDFDFPEFDDLGVPLSRRLIIHNGLVHGVTELMQTLPKGVVILPLSIAMAQHETLVKPYLNQIMKVEHGFHALNSAMIQSGVFIYVPEGVTIEEPIALIHVQNHSGQAVYCRNLIVAAPSSTVSVVEVYQGEVDCSYFTNTLTEVYVDHHAKVTHYKMQRESLKSYHVGHIFVNQMAYSHFNSHSLSLGGQWVRSDINIHFVQEYAQCIMNGIYAPKEGQHVDHHTRVEHAVPNCRSQQDYKGILQGKSRAVFNGKVIVELNAQHSDATQQNKNLLLSKDAEIDTKPQLEIFADDVVCTHGATVGQLDEDALFYLATRGIARHEAAQYLINAFTIDNIQLVEHSQLAQWMGDLVTLQVG